MNNKILETMRKISLEVKNSLESDGELVYHSTWSVGEETDEEGEVKIMASVVMLVESNKDDEYEFVGRGLSVEEAFANLIDFAGIDKSVLEEEEEDELYYN
jgi:hypothetical protein